MKWHPITYSHLSLQTLLIPILLLALAGTCLSQQAGSSSNNPSRGSAGATVSHTIRGKIFMPSGNFPDQRIRVVLELSTGGVASETFSDSVGNFEFRGLPNNSYKVTVPTDRNRYEAAQEIVEAYGNFTRTFTVQIYLKSKESEPSFITKEKILSPADIQEVPKAAKKSYDQGVKLARANKPEEALIKFQDALKVFPDYLHALNKLGEQYVVLNRPDDAKVSFERAVVLNGKFALPHINLGILYVAQRRYDEAISELENANNLDGTYPMGHLHLGLALMSKSQPDFDRAEKEMIQAVEMGQRDFIYVRKYLFNLNIRRQTYNKAAEQLEAYLRDAPDAPDAQDVRHMLDKVKKEMSRQAAMQKPH
ncbi:MAG: hypothetical protein AB7P14_04990 [Blastocatellales bacterium]